MRKQVKDTNLRLMVFESARELGEKVNEHLLEMYKISKEDIICMGILIALPLMT